ncbi:MAG: NUMOD4 domain-containing protein [Lachnospiraceae bacterium]
MIETWKDIPGYNGKYQADTEGNVRRVYLSGKYRLMTPYRRKMSGSQRLVVKLTKDKKQKEEIVIQIVAKTFLGEVPNGYVPYHKNGVQSDNYVNNIGYISRQELGRLTGAQSRRKGVAKIDGTGEVVEFYTSAREAGRKNYMNNQTITDRCNGRCKSAFAPDGFAYAWEDSEASMRRTIRAIELEKGYMPTASDVEFKF